jgi:hypothetical protein
MTVEGTKQMVSINTLCSCILFYQYECSKCVTLDHLLLQIYTIPFLCHSYSFSPMWNASFSYYSFVQGLLKYCFFPLSTFCCCCWSSTRIWAQDSCLLKISPQCYSEQLHHFTISPAVYRSSVSWCLYPCQHLLFSGIIDGGSLNRVISHYGFDLFFSNG